MAAMAGAAVAPAAAFAQARAELPKIGMVYPGPREVATSRVEAVVSGLRTSGFARAQIELTVRTTEGDPRLVKPMIDEVIEKGASVIVAAGPNVLQALIATGRDLPIVALDLESDPVASHLANSLAHPGRNVTGVFMDFPNFAGKWIELLIESVPKLSRIGVLWDPATGGVQLEAVTRAASGLNIQADVFETKTGADMAGAAAGARQKDAQALVITSSPIVPANAKMLADLAVQHKLPAITLFPDFARAGGLMAYGPNLLTMYRQIGVMVGKILHGEKPGDVPIERPSKFELIVNQRAAEALGMTLPLPVLLRADEVID
jgi:putative ABC transport system substrate-binding protein